jgi:hypothetical protein
MPEERPSERGSNRSAGAHPDDAARRGARAWPRSSDAREWPAIPARALLLLASVACDDPSLVSTTPCGWEEVRFDLWSGRPSGVALLLVVDDGDSAALARERLVASLPRLIDTWLDGDVGRDGRRDYNPYARVTVGVVTTALGTGGRPVPGCSADPWVGDGACLRNGGAAARGARPCRDRSDLVVRFLRDEPPEVRDASLAELARRVRAVARAGDDCPLAQPLGAALLALAPAPDHGPTIPRGSELPEGRGGPHGFNAELTGAGLSQVVVLVVTPRDDCTFRPAPAHAGSSALQPPEGGGAATSGRCGLHPDALRDPAWLAETLRRIPIADAHSFVFGALVGVPEDLTLVHPDARLLPLDALALLGDPRLRLREAVGPDGLARVEPACTSPPAAAPDGVGERSLAAEPPARMIGFLGRLGDAAALGSVCATDPGPFLDGVAERAFAKVDVPCVEDPGASCVLLVPDPGERSEGAGRAPCAEFADTSTFAWLGLAPIPWCRRERVRVSDEGVPVGSGYYFDRHSPVARLACGDRLDHAPRRVGALRLTLDWPVTALYGHRFECVRTHCGGAPTDAGDGLLRGSP